MRRLLCSLACAASLILESCGGTSGNGSSTSTTPPATSAVYTVPAPTALTTADVQQIIAQAVSQSQADNKNAVISVVDRVGNVLAVFKMNGAPATVTIDAAPNGVNADVQGVSIVPSAASAIAKAVTGAYLSSSGNAFSTRTASMIVQATFPPEPATAGLGSGPLYGVQFSQLPCSDLSARFAAGGGSTYVNPATGVETSLATPIGPKRSPLGLAADPGGFPLYKNGVVVGGIGVEADGLYSADYNVSQPDNLVTDERIALAGTIGFAAPGTITADQIYVAGTQFIYSDVAYSALASVTGGSYASASISGTLVAVRGYYAGTAVLAGSAYGAPGSGVQQASSADGSFTDPDVFILTDGAGNNRYPPTGGSDAADVTAPLTANEVRTVLTSAFAVMSKARAQIRQPLNSFAQVSISVVDTHGRVLGIVRSPDAPIFGIDVSLQKARTAAFFSNAAAGAQLSGATTSFGADVPAFVAAARTFLADPTALTGKYAFTDRAGGDLSRTTFPDGSAGRPNGPFSRPLAQFNPFSTGLQSALIKDNLFEHVGYTLGANADTAHRCTKIPDVVPGLNRLQNGIQIFPGSVPIYRGNVLIGGLGVSGDGIDQDDMISFLGLNNAGTALGTGIGNAPATIRADTIIVPLNDGTTARLRYISCPQSPFVNSSAQNVCQGL